MTTDDYAQRFMGTEGKVLFRERVRMAWWGHLAFLAAFLLAIHSLVVTGAWLGLVVVPFGWVTLMALRVAVTRYDVHLQLGLFGPRIPLADVESVEAVKGGFLGLRARLALEPIFSVPSASRDLVRIVYRKGDRRQALRFSSRDPQRMVRAIESARTAGWATIARVPGAAPAAVRVPPVEAAPSAAETAARELAEAEAELEEELGNRTDPWARRGSR
jgi:hypothetical protein